MAVIDMSKPINVPAAVVEAVVAIQRTSTDVGAVMVRDSQMDGEFSNKDVSIPYLKLGHATTKGFSDNPAMLGCFVYAEGTVLGKSITVIFLRMGKSYLEKTDYGDDRIAQKWTRVADAEASGLEFVEHVLLDLLIEVPKDRTDLEDLIYTSVGGTDFLAARLDTKTRAMRNTAGVLLRDKDAWLQGMFKNGKYTMSADKKTDGKNTWYVPILKACGPTSKELRDEIQTRFGI